MTAPEHPGLEKLQQYCAGELPDFEEMALEDHFGECDECLAAVRRMDALLFGGFTAGAHAAALEGEARLADPLAAALRLALRTHQQFAAALQSWLGSAAAVWGGGAIRQWGEGALLPASGSDTAALRVRLDPGEYRGEIDIREARQTVEIEQGGAEGQLAMLFQSGEETSARVSSFERVAGVAVARFEDIPEGHYYLAISPR